MCLGTNVCGHKRVWAQTCVGTNVCGHKRVWAQSCVFTIVCGHKPVWAQTCLGTIMCGHKRVWAQTCLGTIVCGHNHVWAQLCLGTIVCGHNRVWAQSCLGTIVSGHNRVWAQSCVGTIVCGHNRVWAQSCVGTIVCGHNRVWAQSCGLNHVWAQSWWNRLIAIRNKKGNITQVDEVVNILAVLLTIKVKQEEDLEQKISNFNVQDLPGSWERNVVTNARTIEISQGSTQRRRFSQEFLMKCVIWARISPKLYRDFAKNSGLILPSWSHIRRFTSFTKFRGKVGPISYKYFKMHCKKLDTKDKILHMAIDEVYTVQFLEMSGGSFFWQNWLTINNDDAVYSCELHCKILPRYGCYGTNRE